MHACSHPGQSSPEAAENPCKDRLLVLTLSDESHSSTGLIHPPPHVRLLLSVVVAVML